MIMVAARSFARREVPEVQPEVGQGDERDPAFPDPSGRLGDGADDAAGGRDFGHDGPCRSSPACSTANQSVRWK